MAYLCQLDVGGRGRTPEAPALRPAASSAIEGTSGIFDLAGAEQLVERSRSSTTRADVQTLRDWPAITTPSSQAPPPLLDGVEGLQG